MYGPCVNVFLCFFIYNRQTEGYSGSDLTALARDAALGPIRGRSWVLLIWIHSKTLLKVWLICVLFCCQNFDPTKSSAWTQLRWNTEYLRPFSLVLENKRLYWGAFQSTKNSETFETRANDADIVCESLQNFRGAPFNGISWKFSGTNSNGTEILGERFCKIRLYLVRLSNVLFPKISGKCCSILRLKFLKIKQKFLVEWKAPLSLEEF